MSTITPASRPHVILCALMVVLVAAIALVPWRIVAQEAAAGDDPKRADQPATGEPVATEARIFALKHADAQEVSGHILRLFRGDPKNPTRVQASADERTNAVIVVAPVATMKEIDQLLQKLDTPAGEAAGDPAGHRLPGRGEPGDARRRGVDRGPARPQGTRVMGRLFADVITLRAPADGLVQQVVRDGADVKKGEGIIRLDERRAKAALMAAEAQYRLAETQLKRVDAIRKNNNVSEAEVQQAEAELRVTAANMELRREDLQELAIVAPRSGIVSDVKVHEGERVQKGAELATLVDAEVLKVAFHLDPVNVAPLKVGQKVQLTTSPPQGDGTHEAEIYFIDPRVEVDVGTMGTIEVRAKLKAPAAGLRSGAMVNVYLPPPEKAN